MIYRKFLCKIKILKFVNDWDVFIDCDDFFWLRKNYNLYNFRYIFKVVVFDKIKDYFECMDKNWCYMCII